MHLPQICLERPSLNQQVQQRNYWDGISETARILRYASGLSGFVLMLHKVDLGTSVDGLLYFSSGFQGQIR